MRALARVLKYTGLVLGGVILFLLIIIGAWYLRPNRSRVAGELGLDHWAAVSDGEHNSNTDLVWWKDAFYLVHASGPWHFASERTHLAVRRSEDGRLWEVLAELASDGEDIRDPKFTVINGRLYLYALKNTDFSAEPYSTVFAASDDGITWDAFRDIQPEGWLFWRPKTNDGQTWYAPAYWHEHGRSALFRSADGENWEMVSLIHEGERNDETAIEFLPDGRMISTVRLEVSDSYFGDNAASTLIALSSPPYNEWADFVRNDTTRLDGPTLFRYRDRVYAAGRYQPFPRHTVFQLGSIFSRKRTSLFLVEEDRLVYLSDLPSAGDTSYTGVVVQENAATISYYTSCIDRDYPWIMGMLLPSDIRIAEVDLDSLEALADSLK